jgi:hypothetical protein
MEKKVFDTRYVNLEEKASDDVDIVVEEVSDVVECRAQHCC